MSSRPLGIKLSVVAEISCTRGWSLNRIHSHAGYNWLEPMGQQAVGCRTIVRRPSIPLLRVGDAEGAAEPPQAQRVHTQPLHHAQGGVVLRIGGGVDLGRLQMIKGKAEHGLSGFRGET